MLYTARVTNLSKIQREMKVYDITSRHGNDEVSPEQADFNFYKNGVITWEGFKLNYLAKIYKTKASVWMKNVSKEAAIKDIVLVDEEKDENLSCRKLLAELMYNMYSGEISFQYAGEIIT